MSDSGPALDAATRAAGGDEGWWQTVSTRLQREEYEATLSEGDLQAPNRAQNLRTVFGPHGIEVGPRVVEGGAGGATAAWRFGWETAGIGRRSRMREAGRGVLEHEGARVRYVRSGWSEWYENTTEGLEQGFTVDVRPGGKGPLRIMGSLQAGLRAEWKDDAVDFLDAHGACVLRYGKLIAYDADRVTLPSKLVLEKQNLIIEVDDRGAAYPITIDPVMTSPSWTFESNIASTYIGVCVATAGDVNGDGFSDVIVGAYGYDNGETNEGRAYLFMGSFGGLASGPQWTAESNQAFTYFGNVVAPAGDVNGDGFSDVIVTADAYDNGQIDEGRVFVYHGSAAGLGAAPAWTAESDQDSTYFGVSAATAGDVNGDGFSDVIVGGPQYDNGQTNEGRAFVYHGSPAGLGTTPAWTAEGNQADLAFGRSVATAGDVNADGFADVIIGAPLFQHTQFNEGAIFVYQGSSGGLGTSPEIIVSGSAGALFGTAVSTAGDVNGDGFSDVIVGAWYYSNGQISEGAVFVYHGTPVGVTAPPAWVVEGNQSDSYIGYSVATAGDVNGDGFADVIVGAHRYDNGEANEGRAFLYKGSASGLSTIPAWTAESNQVDALMAGSVATAGDVNGDGYSDVIVGAEYYDNGQTDEGRVCAYYGGADSLSTNASWALVGGQANCGWGYVVTTAGDVNADGYSDVLVVADRYDNGQGDEGVAWVYHGSASGVSIFPSWAAETNQVGAEISSAASAGDVNGDGYSDVIIGSYHYDNGQSDEGRAFLYLGSSTGLGFSPAWTSEPDQASAWFGWSVASAGDVNGDGYSDVIVGADGWDNGHNNEGRAWLYLGGPGGLTSASWAVEGNQEGAHLGYSVSTAGDVNRDGFSDVVIGVPVYDSGEDNEGVVWVYHGSVTGLGSLAWEAEGDQADASFGTCVSTAGDVNGDGYSDVIIGASAYDNGETNEGRAFAFYGGLGGLAGAPAWTMEINQASAQLGRSVATAGDVNGDGYSDVLVGIPFYDYVENDEGAVELFYGSPNGLDAVGGIPWFTNGGQSGAFYGLAVGTAGDVNADGFSDVIVGGTGYNSSFSDEGAVWVFLGNEGDGLHRIRRQLRTDTSGPIAILGRSNSTSSVRLQGLARTAAGRAKVRLEIEMKPVGAPFIGNELVKSTFAQTGAPGSDGSTVSILHDVTGLPSGSFFHWRVRFASDSPFFPRSPWLWLPYNAMNEGDVRTAGPSATGIASGAAAPPATGHWLGRALPNPFAGSTEFTYALPKRMPVRLGVFDVQGRLVASLAEGPQDAGEHHVHWDGHDDAGHRVSAGVYFVRMEADERVEAQKLVLMR